MTEIQDKIRKINDRISEAALRAGRTAEDIKLIAVTKTHPVERIREAIEGGLNYFGENRVQEAAEKIPLLSGVSEWHLVGHLQRNKVKKALELFDCIHSVDSERLAVEISTRAQERGRRIPCLVEVNTSGEDSKYGVQPGRTVGLCEKISTLEGIELTGLMTIGPFTGDPEDARPCFQLLRRLKEEAVRSGQPAERFRQLSMGMTSDFEIAIEEGATMVRIGSALFGQRHY